MTVPATVRDAFGVAGGADAIHLPGNTGGVQIVGGIALKQVSDPAEAAWEQEALASLPARADVRWPRPVAAADGRWVVDGWVAHGFVSGLRPVAPDWCAVIDAGRRFHHATAHLVPPAAMLAARTHRWARGERHAFDEETVELPGSAAAVDRDLARRCRPDPHPVQFVHVDLAPNVFVDPADAPVLLDIAVGGRTPGYASGVVVADALVWHDAGLDLLDALVPDGDPVALVARALRFRLVTDVLAAAAAGTDLASDRYARIARSLPRSA